MSQEKALCSEQSLFHKVVLFFAGFCNFLMGYALYIIFKNDKSKEWQIKCIKSGSTFGLVFTIISLYVYIYF